MYKVHIKFWLENSKYEKESYLLQPLYQKRGTKEIKDCIIELLYAELILCEKSIDTLFAPIFIETTTLIETMNINVQARQGQKSLNFIMLWSNNCHKRPNIDANLIMFHHGFMNFLKLYRNKGKTIMKMCMEIQLICVLKM